jgi:hypothetical protein
MIFKPFFSTIFNASVLAILGLWGFLSVPQSSVTALIPVFGASVLFVLTPALKHENRKAAHAIVIITFILLLGLIKPLTGSIERGNVLSIVRVTVMMLTGVYALATYVKSFIDARKNR